MQCEIDLKSEHKDLFLEARTLLLSIDEIIETKKEDKLGLRTEKANVYSLDKAITVLAN